VPVLRGSLPEEPFRAFANQFRGLRGACLLFVGGKPLREKRRNRGDEHHDEEQ
jgi:hypothetical protein